MTTSFYVSLGDFYAGFGLCSTQLFFMSIDKDQLPGRSSLEDSKGCLGIRKRMSQVVGVFMIPKNNDATREKFKGTYPLLKGWSLSVYGRILNSRWIPTPFQDRMFEIGSASAPEYSVAPSGGGTVRAVRIPSRVDSNSHFCPQISSVDQEARIEASIISRAETTSFEEEHANSVTSIEFRIKHRVEFGESVSLVGSVRELGRWDPSEAIPLEWSEGDNWKCKTELKRAEVSRMEYKYIVKRENSDSVEWEAGGNHNVLRPAARDMVQEDFWEFPGYNIRV